MSSLKFPRAGKMRYVAEGVTVTKKMVAPESVSVIVHRAPLHDCSQCESLKEVRRG